MNGKTKIDSLLNPCTAEMDRRTYGIPYVLGFTTYGNRWLKIMLFSLLTIDIHKSNLIKFMYCRRNDAGSILLPYIVISWWLPKLHKNT